MYQVVQSLYARGVVVNNVFDGKSEAVTVADHKDGPQSSWELFVGDSIVRYNCNDVVYTLIIHPNDELGKCIMLFRWEAVLTSHRSEPQKNAFVSKRHIWRIWNENGHKMGILPTSSIDFYQNAVRCRLGNCSFTDSCQLRVKFHELSTEVLLNLKFRRTIFCSQKEKGRSASVMHTSIQMQPGFGGYTDLRVRSDGHLQCRGRRSWIMSLW